MGSRYGRQDNERRGRGMSRERPGSESGRGSSGGSRFGSSRFGGSDADENYFGSGRQSYGEGYTGGSNREHGYDTYPRDYEEGYSSYDEGRLSFGSREPRYQSDRDHERRFGPERERRDTSGGYSGRSGGNYGRGEYGPSYPESESGYRTEGEYRGDDRGWWDKASDEVSSWFGDEEAERRREMDERRSRNFRGRGPKNYTRSDDRIREDINDRLTDYPYIDASEIDVEVNNGDVVLKGTVDSRYDKRLAEDIAEDISGVKNVENRIRVERNYSQFSEGGWSYSDTAGHTESGRTAANRNTSTTGRTAASNTEAAASGTTTPAAKTRGKAAGSS